MKKIAVLILLLTLAFQAKASDVVYDQTTVYLGVRTGTLMVDTIDGNHDISFGVMFGVKFNEALGVELSYDNQFNGLFGTGWSTDAYQASLLLYLPASDRVQLYLVGGVGVYQSTYNYWESDGWDSHLVTDVNYSDGGFHAGAGIDIGITPNVAMTLDARYIFVEDNGPYANRADGLLATVGFKFRF